MVERSIHMVQMITHTMNSSDTKALFGQQETFSVFEKLVEAEGYRLERVMAGTLYQEQLSDGDCEGART
jgi:hypothetical protein